MLSGLRRVAHQAGLGAAKMRHRSLRPVTAAATGRKGSEEVKLTVMTYNLLAEKYAGFNASYVAPEDLSWPVRSARIQEELAGLDADIVCLQEVEEQVFRSELQPFFEQRGLQGWFQSRQMGEVGLSRPEGVALFVRTSILEPVETRSIKFNDTPQALPFTERDTQGSDIWATFQHRDEGALMAMLRHKASGTRLIAASTHLFWDPRYPDVKAMQAAVLCHELARFSQEGPQAGSSSAAAEQHQRQPQLAAAGAGRAAVSAEGRGSSLQSGQEAAGPGPGSLAAGGGGAQRGSARKRGRHVPMIVAGDFNSLAIKCKPDVFDKSIPKNGLVSGVYTLLSTGELSPQHQDHPATRRLRWGGGGAGLSGLGLGLGSSSSSSNSGLQVPLHSWGVELESAYYVAHGREPTLTTKTSSFAGCLDYIWVSPHFSVAQTLDMPYEEPDAPCKDPMTDVDFAPIPNDVFPSDHLAMAAVLALSSPENSL